MSNNDVPEAIRPFIAHGAVFISRGARQWRGTAPFSKKPGKLHVNPTTGLWDEKVTGDAGGLTEFLEKVQEMYRAAFTPARKRELARLRALPERAFDGWNLGYDRKQQAFTFPCHEKSGRLRDIRRWSARDKVMRSTSGCNTQLFGMRSLSKAEPGTKVWGCEGEWDAIALLHLLREAGHVADVVVAVPGAQTFKREWASSFDGRHVRLCYDNDEPGRKGAAKAAKVLATHASTLEALQWPEGYRDGYDVRDFVVERLGKGASAQSCVKKLLGLMAVDEPTTSAATSNIEVDSSDTPSFAETLEVFGKYLKMTPDMTTALASLFAVALSTRSQGPPLWLYLIGPPGCGKTTLVDALSSSHRAHAESTLKHTSLISGFQSGGGDPSLLPKLRNKTLIIRDLTPALEQHPAELKELQGVLRDAFDGEVVRSYGNGIERRYESLKFTVIAAVTPAILRFQDSTLGERFLKLQIASLDGADTMDLILAAMEASGRGDDAKVALRQAARDFLARRTSDDELPGVPDDMKVRIARLSDLVAWLRAEVDREKWGDRDLVCRPYREVATRLAIQLHKFARFIAVVHGKELVDDAVMRTVERVAFDTGQGFKLEVVEALVRLGGQGSAGQVAGKIGIPTRSARRHLEDLADLGAVTRCDKEGPKGDRGSSSHLWVLTPSIAGLWDAAQVRDQHAERLVKGRLPSTPSERSAPTVRLKRRSRMTRGEVGTSKSRKKRKKGKHQASGE